MKAEKIPPSHFVPASPALRPEQRRGGRPLGWRRTPPTRAEVAELIAARLPLTAEHIALYLTCSKRTVARMERDGRLPRALRHNERMVRWSFEQYRSALQLEGGADGK